jgi:hypothetical protein
MAKNSSSDNLQGLKTVAGLLSGEEMIFNAKAQR